MDYKVNIMKYIIVLLIFGLAEAVDLAEREDIQRIDVTEGDTLSLTCKARTSLLRSYRWVYIREGTRKPRVLSSGRRLVVGEPRLKIEAQARDDYVALILTFEEIRPYEAGLFMCWRQGLKPDPQVYVRVLEIGAEEAEPLSIEIYAPNHVKYGGSVAVNCLIRPSWPGKVLWLKDNHEIDPSDPSYTQHVEEKETGELLASLNINSIRQGANFTCRVPDTSAVEASVHLVVKVARIESLISDPLKDEILYGENLSITCIVSGADPEQMLWLKDGNNLEVGKNYNGFQKFDELLPTGNLKSTLFIEKFSKKDNGHYLCYVPGDSKGVLVNIEGRPAKLLEVKGWDFVVGEVLRLTCSTQYVKNKNEKRVTWLFEGNNLRSDWWAEEVLREDIHNITHHDLSLPIPTRGHVGTYTCSTPYGNASTEVREIVPPYVEESPPVRVNIPEGGTLTLPCVVAGYPLPIVAWEKSIGGQWKIVEEARQEEEEEVMGIQVMTERAMEGDKTVGERQELVIREILPVHEGTYRCRGYNERDTVVVETQISVIEAIPTIMGMTADDVTEGEDLVIKCAVKNWNEPVKFIHGIRVLGLDEDQRYSVQVILTEEENDEEEEEEEERKKVEFTKRREKLSAYALVVSDVTVDDEGFYECHAGPDASVSISVKIKQAPPEVFEVAASPAIEGGELFVSCSVANMPTDEEAVFYFDGKNLNEETDKRYAVHLAELTDERVVNLKGRAKLATYVLKVNPVTANDSGVYHCVVGSETRSSVSVEVEELKDIETVHLEATSTWVGGDLTLQCTVTNWEGEVSFLQNSTLLLNEEDSRYNLSKKTEADSIIYTFKIFDATTQDSGLYQCFTSPVMSSEANVTIQDLENLEINFEQPRESLWVGSDMILDCSTKGFADLAHTIEFSHRGRPYLYFDPSKKGAQVKARATLMDNSDETSGSSLSYKMRLENVEKSDAGTWICRATIPEAGFVLEEIVNVEVFEYPLIVEFPESEISVKEGTDAVLDCVASGLPLPATSWQKKGSEEILATGKERAQLLLESFSHEDSGAYICSATSLNHTVYSETKLQVEKYVKIIEAPESELLLPKFSAVELRCAALGTETPYVAWYKMGSDDKLAHGNSEAVYTISELFDEDAGTYICRAESSGAEAVEHRTEIVIDTRTSSQTSPPSTTLAPTLVAGKLVKITGPDTVEEGESATLMCLVSPLLAYYKYIILFNDTMLTYDEALVHDDPRFSVTTGTGGVEERLIRLTIRNTSVLDSGSYECTVNTSPIARHIHRLNVVPLGYRPSIITIPPLISEIIPSQESIHHPETTSTTPKAVNESTSDFWDTDVPFIFSSIQTTSRRPSIHFEPTSFSVETPEVDHTAEHMTTELPPPHVYPQVPTYTLDEDGDPTDLDERKYVLATARIGERVVLHCTIYTENQIPIMWKKDSTGTLLFADNVQVQNDKRFSIEVVDVFDEHIRDLIITNATLGDSGLYTCFLQSNPPIENYVELHVTDRDIPEVSIIYGKDSSGKDTLENEIEREDDREGATSEESGGEEDQIPGEGDEEKQETDTDVAGPSTSEGEEKGIGEETEEEDYIRYIAGVEEKEMEEHGMKEVEEPEVEHEIAEEDRKESQEDRIKLLLDVEEEEEKEEAEYEDIHETEIGEKEEFELEGNKEYKNETKEEEEGEEDGSFDKEYEEGLIEDDVDTTDYTTTTTPPVPESAQETTIQITFKDSEPHTTTSSPADSNLSYVIDGETDDKSNITDEYDTEYELKEYEMEDYDKIPKLVDATGPPLEENEEEEEDEERVVDEEESAIIPTTSVTSSVLTDSIPDSYTTTTHSILMAEEEDEVIIDSERDEHQKEPEDEEKERDENEIYTDEDDKEKEKEESREEKKEKIEISEEVKDTEGDEKEDEDKLLILDYDYEYEQEITTTKPTASTTTTTTTTTQTIKTKVAKEPSIPEHPVIIGNPGEDVKAPPEAEVVLPCPTDATPEDITWKDSEKLLFLGSLDLAGVKGLALSPEGALRLLPGIATTKDDKSYTCFVYDYDTYEDAPVMTYWIEISEGEPHVIKGPQSPNNQSTNQTTTSSPPTATYEFPGLEWQEVAVISNSEISGISLVEVLQEGGINARLATKETCRRSKEIKGWNEAQESLKECEFESRASELLRSGQSVFIIIDFTVRLPTDKLYGSTLIYVHNVATNLKAHVFGPLVPFPPEGNGSTAVECGSPVYSSQTQGLDIAAFCKSSVASTILTLQESYLSHSRKLPMA